MSIFTIVFPKNYLDDIELTKTLNKIKDKIEYIINNDNENKEKIRIIIHPEFFSNFPKTLEELPKNEVLIDNIYNSFDKIFLALIKAYGEDTVHELIEFNDYLNTSSVAMFNNLVVCKYIYTIILNYKNYLKVRVKSIIINQSNNILKDKII